MTTKTAVLERLTIVDTLLADGSFATLVHAIRATDTERLLTDTDLYFTLFAPNERAFKKLSPWGSLRAMLDDKDLLTKVIHYHIVPNRVMTRHIEGRKLLRTMAGQHVIVDTLSDLSVNNAGIIRSDIECANGVIHEIDSVLMPK